MFGHQNLKSASEHPPLARRAQVKFGLVICAVAGTELGSFFIKRALETASTSPNIGHVLF
jgi:hypothetical protein